MTKRFEDLPRTINQILGKLRLDEQLLVIVPDERDIKQLLTFDFDVEPVLLTSDSSKSDRYRNYLKARFLQSKLIVGNRGSIFTPLAPN